MAIKDINGDFHAENNGQYVSEDKIEVAKTEVKREPTRSEDVEHLYNDDASLERITSRRRRTQPTNEFATLAMQWAHSDKTEIGEQKFFYRKGKWVLLEKSEDGFVEMGYFSKAQRESVGEEIRRQNERLRNNRENEGVHRSAMRYKDI